MDCKSDYRISDTQLKAIASRFEGIYSNVVDTQSVDLKKYEGWYMGLPTDGMALVEDSLEAYSKTIEQLLEISWVQEFFSRGFLENQVNQVIRKEYRNLENRSLDSKAAIQNLLDGIKSSVESWTIAVPVSGVVLRGIAELGIGNVTIRKLTGDSPLLEKAKKILSGNKDLLKEYIGPIEDKVVAFQVEKGEPERAREKAVSAAEHALDVLRLYSTFFFEARESKISLGLRPRIDLWDFLSVEMDKEKVFLFKTPPLIHPFDFEIDERTLRGMKDMQFGIVDDILKKTNRTALEKQILDAIKWFGLARQMDDDASSFLAYYIALDMLLSEKRSDPPEWSTSYGERIAESVAFLIRHSVEERKRIKDYQKKLWALRSNIAHSGGWSEKDKRRLPGIQETVKQVIIALLERRKEFGSKKDLHQWVETQRFSTPPVGTSST
jgi:hypothetical protein